MNLVLTIITVLVGFMTLRVIKSYNSKAEPLSQSPKFLGYAILVLLNISLIGIFTSGFLFTEIWPSALIIVNAGLLIALLGLLVYEQHRWRTEWSNKVLKKKD